MDSQFFVEAIIIIFTPPFMIIITTINYLIIITTILILPKL